MNKKEALEKLIASLQNSNDESVKTAIATLMAKGQKGRANGITTSVYDTLASHHKANGNKPLDIDTIYQCHGVGVHELNGKYKRHYVKSVPGEKRLWLTVDTVNRTVTVHGIGERPPAGYNGYVPIKGLDKYNDKK